MNRYHHKLTYTHPSTYISGMIIDPKGGYVRIEDVQKYLQFLEDTLENTFPTSIVQCFINEVKFD